MKKWFLYLALITFWFKGQIVAVISCNDLECAEQKFFQCGEPMPVYDRYEIKTTSEPQEL